MEDVSYILLSWHTDDKLYKRFLEEEDASVLLEKYEGYSVENDEFVFTTSDVKVLSPKYAAKFFAHEDDEVNQTLMTIICNATFDEEHDIYAFPYLEGDIVNCMSAEFINLVLLDMHFIFNMSEDIYGLIYNCLYEKLAIAEENTTLLAINSFNQTGFMSMENHSLEERVIHQTMANSAMANGGGDTDAYFRKLMIQYIYGTSELVTQTMTKINLEHLSRCN